jgi:stage IV sporulation protein FB
MTFRVGKCRVTVGVPFLAVVALVLALDRSGMAFAGFLCGVLHEAAHILAMNLLGNMPEQMRFTAFGIDIVRQNEQRSYKRDALVSLAGPAANLAAAILLICIPQTRQSIYFYANLVLFAFNALPIAPLDGGQVLRALLCIKTEPEKADRIVTAVSLSLLLPLATAGFFILIQTGWNITLLLAVCYLAALLMLKRER